MLHKFVVPCVRAGRRICAKPNNKLITLILWQKLKTVDNHAAIAASNDVAQLCQPLFKATDVSFFNYVRMFNDGRRLSIGSKAEWLKHYFDSSIMITPFFKKYSRLSRIKIDTGGMATSTSR